MNVLDQLTSSRKFAKRSIQAHLEGLCELTWVLGIIRSSRVPEIVQMMMTLRGYGSEARWTTLLQQLQPNP